MITENVKRFIELQTTINNQIGWDGQAEERLVDELDELGNQLTNDEISVISVMMYEDTLPEDMEYDDIEWSIE